MTGCPNVKWTLIFEQKGQKRSFWGSICSYLLLKLEEISLLKLPWLPWSSPSPHSLYYVWATLSHSINEVFSSLSTLALHVLVWSFSYLLVWWSTLFLSSCGLKGKLPHSLFKPIESVEGPSQLIEEVYGVCAQALHWSLKLPSGLDECILWSERECEWCLECFCGFANALLHLIEAPKWEVCVCGGECVCQEGLWVTQGSCPLS